MLRQLGEKSNWKIHADRWKQLAVPADIVNSSLRSESELQTHTQLSVYSLELSPAARRMVDEGRAPFGGLVSHMYEFRDL